MIQLRTKIEEGFEQLRLRRVLNSREKSGIVLSEELMPSDGCPRILIYQLLLSSMDRLQTLRLSCPICEYLSLIIATKIR